VKIFDIYMYSCFQYHMYLTPHPPNLFQRHILVFVAHVSCIISAVIKITHVSFQLQHGYFLEYLSAAKLCLSRLVLQSINFSAFTDSVFNCILYGVDSLDYR